VSGILVTHPHLSPFSAGVAASLAREGQLAGFFTGVAVARQARSSAVVATLAKRFPEAANRIVDDVPAQLLHALPAVELGARAVTAVRKRLGHDLKAYDVMFPAHDRAVSLLPWPSARAVYAYEDGAKWTFERARRRDLARIWDLPLPHYLTIEETFRSEQARWPGAVGGKPFSEPPWKRARKDEELALATTVSVASAFTRRSLERVETSARVIVVPYGFPVETFALRPHAPTGRFTVLSVGTHDLRKGTPYLLEAWRRAALRDAELHLVGAMRLSDAFLAPYRGSFTHWPHVPKSQLAERYGAADLLAFPTLGDGFGIVIQEAMCCGTPVLTTPCGGGPESIDDGANGWVVPPRDVDALVDRLREAARNRDRLFAMGRAARARAERWTWRDAGHALVRELGAS